MQGMMPGPMMPGPMDARNDQSQMQMPQAPQQMAGQEMQYHGMGEDLSEESSARNYLDYALQEANLAKGLRKKSKREVLDKIAERVYTGYNQDELSRSEWLTKVEEWIKLAALVNEGKSFPWPNASNVKYPLVATAAMQFAARAYPSLVPSDGKVVRVKVVGYDQQGAKHQRADRISKHMSYQIMHKMPNWEEDMDRLCVINPIIGVSFKKTYCKPHLKTHCSELVLPQNLVVNYWAKDLESAYRKTEILYYTTNEVYEKVNNNEEFLKETLDYIKSSPVVEEEKQSTKQVTTHMSQPAEQDEATPHVFLAQHTFYDLDDDGYEEPYIITIHKDSRKVVRICARFASDGVIRDEMSGDIIQIKPIEYFTKFGFIPNPDSAIYDLGFGVLLGEINHAVDTIINQLVDAGTLSNMQSGFLGKGLRIKMGQVSFRPGEWKIANATGEEMKNSIIPLPNKDPSAVLLNLLNLLIQSGNQLASIAEIFVGKMPGQNTPATTTQETVEQGMKVFTAIYKRLYRSLAKEFRKIYRLNKIYPGIIEEQAAILDVPLQESDYDGPEDDIVPGADPSGDSSTVKMMKYQQVMQMLLPLGTINPMVLTQQVLEGLDLPAPQGLIVQPQPQQDPNAMKAQAEIQVKQQEAQIKQQMAQAELEKKKLEMQFEQQKNAIEMKMKEFEGMLDLRLAQAQHEQKMAQGQQEMVVNDLRARQALVHEQAAGQQRLAQGQESHKAKLKQQQESQKMRGKGSKNARSRRTTTNNRASK